MEFYVMASTGLTYGGAGPLSHVGDFLLGDRRDFGPAVEEISIELMLPNPPRGIPELLAEHAAARAKTPKVTFARKRAKMAIEVASDLSDADIFVGHPRERGEPIDPVALFRRGVEEVTTALRLMKLRVKPGDDFDLTAFLAHVDAARDRLPETKADLSALTEHLERAAKLRLEAKSPWELIDVDWSQYHPDARTLLDDPFYWDNADDFAPHGNDTGADLLVDYLDVQPARRGMSGADFLADLARGWGYADFAAVDEDMADEAVVGVAFAELKVTGTIAEPMRQRALAVTARQRQAAIDAIDWPHREERLAALDLLDAVLRTAER